MANREPRLFWDNLVRRVATLITPSSQLSGLPGTNVAHQVRSRAWRTPVGWIIIAGFNDKLDFTEATAGDATATIPAGLYVIAEDLAAAIQLAMNAAATNNTYAWTYDTVKGFECGRVTGTTAYGLEWSTGANAPNIIGLDVGFNVSTDDTGLTTYTADVVAFQSRHNIVFDFASAIAIDSWFLTGHNLTTTAIATRQANATDAWSAPTLSSAAWDTAAGDKNYLRVDASSTTLRFHRLVVDDVENQDGFLDLGVDFIGPNTKPSRSLRQGHVESAVTRSTIQVADQGVAYQTKRPEPYTMNGQFHRLSRADRNALIAMEQAIGVGGPLILAMDPLNFANAETYYGVLTRRLAYVQKVGDGAPPDRYDVAVSFMESLN